MELKEIVSLIKGSVVCGEENLNQEYCIAFASDLMSDVLTVKIDNLLLLTGLANIQTIRTAEMSDISCVIFTRNKAVTPEMKALAEESQITLICTAYSTFKTSGILYSHEIKPVY